MGRSSTLLRACDSIRGWSFADQLIPFQAGGDQWKYCITFAPREEDRIFSGDAPGDEHPHILEERGALEDALPAPGPIGHPIGEPVLQISKTPDYRSFAAATY
jgi:hypothetical protein